MKARKWKNHVFSSIHISHFIASYDCQKIYRPSLFTANKNRSRTATVNNQTKIKRTTKVWHITHTWITKWDKQVANLWPEFLHIECSNRNKDTCEPHMCVYSARWMWDFAFVCSLFNLLLFKFYIGFSSHVHTLNVKMKSLTPNYKIIK